MPSFDVTIENTSPLIRYSANWETGTSDDPFAYLYSASSFTLTQKQGESVSFLYYGKNVTVFGSKRVNHGVFHAQLDGNEPSSFSGHTSEINAQFKVPLCSLNGSLGKHGLTVANGENNFLDIDFITFETSVGKEDETLIVNTFEDNHPSFNYSPDSSWKDADKLGTFSGSSGHATTDTSAVVKFTFKGDAIALYGPVGSTYAEKYSVKIDNDSSTAYSAKQRDYRPQEMLFYAGNLGLEEHTLQIQIESADLGTLAIDYAKVYTTPSMGGSFLGSASPNIVTVTATPNGQNTHLPTGVIVGLAFTSVLALLTTLLCMYFMWRQKRTTGPEKLPLIRNPIMAAPSSATTFGTNPENALAASPFIQVPNVPSEPPRPIISSGTDFVAYQPQGKLHYSPNAMQVSDEGLSDSRSEPSGAELVPPPRYTIG